MEASYSQRTATADGGPASVALAVIAQLRLETVEALGGVEAPEPPFGGAEEPAA